ncbi:primosomal protein N' [Aquifex pyrophilus]
MIIRNYENGKFITGIVIGKATGEAEGEVLCFPDPLPFVLPHAFEVARELEKKSTDFYTKILWDFLPSQFDWYEEEFVYLKRQNLKSVDPETLKLVEFLRNKERVPYEILKKSFSWKLIHFLSEKKIIEKKKEWIIPDITEEAFLLAVPVEKAIKGLRSEEKKRLIEFIEKNPLSSREDIRNAGFETAYLGELVKKGILRKVRLPVQRLLKIKAKSDDEVIKREKERILITGTYEFVFKKIREITDKNLKNKKNTLIISTDDGELRETVRRLKKLYGEKVIEISSRVTLKRLFKNWFKAYEDGYVFVGKYKAIFLPFIRLESIMLLNELRNTRYPINNLDIRGALYHLSKLKGAHLIFCSPNYSLESFYLLKRGFFKEFISEEYKPEVKVFKVKEEIISEETYKEIEKNKEKNILFIIPREGYGYLYCPRCESLAECPKCGTFLVYSKERGLVFCRLNASHYKSEKKSCPVCFGKTEVVSVGIEKVKEVIYKNFGKRKNFFFSTSPEWTKAYDVVVLIDGERFLNYPSFRARERLLYFFSTLYRIAKEKLIIQTRNLTDEEIKNLESKKLEKLYEEELKRRKEENLPPYGHVVIIESERDASELIREKVAEKFEAIYDPRTGIWSYLVKVKELKLVREKLRKVKGFNVIMY